MSSSSDCTSKSDLRTRWIPGYGFFALVLCMLLGLNAAPTHALGLGQLQTRSDLGVPFRASIPFFGSGADSVKSACVNAKITALDGTQIAAVRVNVEQTARGGLLSLSTASSIREPVVTLAVNIRCDQPMQREYPVLLTPLDLAHDAPQKATMAKASELEKNVRVPVEEPARPLVRKADPIAEAGVRPVQARKDPNSQRALKQTPLPKPDRNVLKLSSSGYTEKELGELENLALRLSTRLSLVQAESIAVNAGALPAPEASTNAAGVPEPDAHLQAMMKKMDALESETKRLSQLLKDDRLALQETREQGKITQGWLVTLAVFCLVCLVMLAWLARRMYQLYRNNGTRQDDWHAFNAAETDAMMNLTAAESDDTADYDKDIQVALHHAKNPLPQSGATTSQEQEEGAVSRKIIDWPAASAEPPLPVSKKAASENFTDEGGGHYHRKPTGLETKEVLDVMQQAEFWISLQNASAAIEILESHVHVGADHDRSTLPWLLLFDLYREYGLPQQFMLLQQKFAKTFDEPAPMWEEDSAHASVSERSLQEEASSSLRQEDFCNQTRAFNGSIARLSSR